MKITINIEKRHANILIGFLFIVAVVLIVNAQGALTKPNPGHSLSELGDGVTSLDADDNGRVDLVENTARTDTAAFSSSLSSSETFEAYACETVSVTGSGDNKRADCPNDKFVHGVRTVSTSVGLQPSRIECCRIRAQG
jgi:hypothetical protein